MLNVGLTGGIATGKSAVADMLREKGAWVIDFDLLTRNVEEPGQAAWKEIIAFFGGEILNDDGTINRDKLGSIVFHDVIKLAKLNEIVHPFIFQEWGRRISAIEGENPDAIIISDIPLLIEVGAQKLVDMVALVYASPLQQIERLMIRNGCSREDTLQKIASQMPIEDKVPYADIVIDNSASLEITRQRIDAIWVELKKRQKDRRVRFNTPNP